MRAPGPSSTLVVRSTVEILLMNRAFPVDAMTKSFFSGRIRPKVRRGAIVRSPSSVASLDRRAPVRTIRRVPPNDQRAATVSTAVHRFEELIAGRPYSIEVAAVDHDRWRAYIVRVPGAPTALMPFYGSTPDAAADRLRQWLLRAHACASGGPRQQ